MTRSANTVLPTRSVNVTAEVTLTCDMPEWEELVDLMDLAGQNAYWANERMESFWVQVHDAADVALSTRNLMLGRLLLAQHAS